MRKKILNVNDMGDVDANSAITPSFIIEPNVWTTITTRVKGKKQKVTFTDANGNLLSDPIAKNKSDSRTVRKDAQVWFSSSVNGTSAPIEVKNFKVTDLDCNSGEILSQCNHQADWVAKCYHNRSTNLTDNNLDNCLVTADFGTTKECYKCENGYTYDEKQHCITLADAETQGICTSLTGVPASTDECSQCDGGKRNTCAEGKVLVSDGSCVAAISNCDNYDCDGKCLECLNGQYLAQDANVCVSSIEHCVDQESTGECLNCQAEHVEVADDKCCPAILNCKVYNAETCGECDQICEIGETEQNDICHVIIDYCANQNDDSKCNFCEDGYQVASDDDKVCVPRAPYCKELYANEHCATCDTDYIIVSDPALGLDKCVPVIDNCVDYDYATGDCHGCVAAQKLAYDDDVCVPQIPNCGIYESNGECYECVAGYLDLNPTSCHTKIPKCIKQGCSGVCESCAYGQVVLGGECSPVIPYCQDYNSNGDCATCISGQHSHDHECHEDNHCDSYNCEGTCVECADGHTLTEQGVCTHTA